MRHTPKTLLLLLLLCVSFALDARADTLTVTGGTLTTGTFTGGRFVLTGQGFVFQGGVANANVRGCSECRAGDVLTFGAGGSDSDLGSGRPGILNGVEYERLFFDGELVWRGSLTVPFFDTDSLTVTAPFTFDGLLNICTTSTISGCQDGYIFSGQLVGQGIATLELFRYAFNPPGTPPLFGVRSVTYNFTPNTPTPEPATMLLLGTGLIGTACAARRRRRQAMNKDKANGDAA